MSRDPAQQAASPHSDPSEPREAQDLRTLMVAGARWWLIPLVLVLVTFVVGIIVLQSLQFLAPFIYVAN